MDCNTNKELKLQQIPILYVRGTSREVGFAIGRTFKNFIHDVIQKYDFLDNLLIPNYNTPKGLKIYDNTLSLCKRKFPGYVEELEGIAQGSEIPFYKIFLLHIEVEIIPTEEKTHFENKVETGCTCVLSYPNKETLLLGHTEDTRKELRNNLFILDAEILDDSGNKIEKFTTLSYSAVLPGFTMGYNEHGLFHTMNSLVPSNICPEKTPISFLMRALLGAKSLDAAMNILKDEGTGASDGFSVNFIYAPAGQEPVLQNVEVAPNPGFTESRIDTFPVGFGESYAHANKYIRMDVEQKLNLVTGSEKRLEAVTKYQKPFEFKDIEEILSDRSHPNYPIYRGSGTLKTEIGEAATTAIGIFDIFNKKWYIYIDPPTDSSPVAVLPLNF